MRWLILVLVLLIALPFAFAEEKTPPSVSVRIVRSPFPPPETLGAESLAELENAPGHSARAELPTGTGSVALITRVGYVQDFKPGRGEEPEPIRAFLNEGVILDVKSAKPTKDDAWTFDLRITLAGLIRPIPTFTTTLGGKTVTIELPEIRVQRIKKEVEVTPGETIVLHAGSTSTPSGDRTHFYVVLTPAAAGESEEDGEGLAPGLWNR